MKFIITFLLALYSLASYAQRDIPPTTEFKITGLVKKEITYHDAELMKLKQDNLGDVAIRNHKGEQKDIIKGVKCVLLKTLLEEAEIIVDKPKEYGSLYIVLTASDGYKNIYSWSELFNTEVGKHVYILTAQDGKTIKDMPGRILVYSANDLNTGMRYLKGLSKIEVKKID